MSKKLKNDRLIRALNHLPNDRPPVWLMRQAGRYMPSYQKVRKQAGSFMALCKNPELACAVTLQPIDQFNLDAAIIFSDILTIADAMSVDLKFHEGTGPIIHQPIQTLEDVKRRTLNNVNEQVHYVFEAIKQTQHHLNSRVPLIGFSGSPWTLACYMTEGQLSKNHHTIKTMMFQNPEVLEALLQNLEESISHYCLGQIHAGVDALMLFDTWGGQLAYHDYFKYSLNPMQRIIKTIKQKSDIPIVLFTKGCSPWLPELAATECDGIALDYSVNLQRAKTILAGKKAIQGNLDPHALLGSTKHMLEQIDFCLNTMGNVPGYIFNLGHGILKETDPNQVQQLVEHVQSYEPKTT